MRLIEPDAAYLESYCEAGKAYGAAGIDDYVFTDPVQCDLIAKFWNYREGIALKPGRVPAAYYWLVSEKAFIGEIVIRPKLNEALERYGGHIGYGIRKECWNRGYGTLMLGLALQKARQMGLGRVLITCDDGNIASARVIEKNGGMLLDVIENEFAGVRISTRRYQIEL